MNTHTESALREALRDIAGIAALDLPHPDKSRGRMKEGLLLASSALGEIQGVVAKALVGAVQSPQVQAGGRWTPGPFIIREQPGFLTLEVVRGGVRSVVATASDAGICDEHGGTATGNLALYASAPELFAALVLLLDERTAAEHHIRLLEDAEFFDAHGAPATCNSPACDQARAAIAKAGGAIVSAIEKHPGLARSPFPSVASDLVTFQGTGENDTAKNWLFIVSRADMEVQRARGKVQVPKRNADGVRLSHVWEHIKDNKAADAYARKHGWPFTVHLANLERCEEVQS